MSFIKSIVITSIVGTAVTVATKSICNVLMNIEAEKTRQTKMLTDQRRWELEHIPQQNN